MFRTILAALATAAALVIPVTAASAGTSQQYVATEEAPTVLLTPAPLHAGETFRLYAGGRQFTVISASTTAPGWTLAHVSPLLPSLPRGQHTLLITVG